MSVPSPRHPADVFEYLARFSNAAHWDPGVSSAEEITPGPPACGSAYRLVVKFLGLSVPLEYRIEEIDPPTRVSLRAENSIIRSTDVIEVAPADGGGSIVTYEATLAPKGVSTLLEPLLGAVFRGIGDRAAAGLRAALAA
jgi:Polyketide cyclase / dehydrase and lipid transport